ncbi:MAG: DUF4328 domain-containing protein, partial [Myxococcota bacterium]
MNTPYAPSPDPFAKVRGLSGPLAALLIIRASMRALTYLVFEVTSPPPGQITEAQLDQLLLVDGALLGLESLLSFVSFIVFLVWIHRVLSAIRSTGQTSMSPGLAVGGWFIPLANAVLPWLSVRSALKGLGMTSALAGVWWLLWLANTSLSSLHQMLRQIRLVPELSRAIPYDMMDKLYSMAGSTFWPYMATD